MTFPGSFTPGDCAAAETLRELAGEQLRVFAGTPGWLGRAESEARLLQYTRDRRREFAGRRDLTEYQQERLALGCRLAIEAALDDFYGVAPATAAP